MKFIYLIYIVIIVTFIRCYDDKGNYDYNPLNRVEIDLFTAKTSIFLGDTIQISPVLKFAQDSTEEGLEFEWTLFGTRKIKSRNLFYIADTIVPIRSDIVLRITDTQSGIVYSQDQSIMISTEYEADGYMLLSRGSNNESILSYVRIDYNTNHGVNQGQEPNYFNCREYYNIYEKVNNSPLGNGPIRLLQHFHNSNNENKGEAGSYWIIQDEPDCIDISGINFTKTTNLQSQFDGNKFPTGFAPADMVDFTWSTFVSSKNGKLYTRKKATEFLFNSGIFIDRPVILEGSDPEYEIKNVEFIHHRYGMFIGGAILYDKDLHRFFTMHDGIQAFAGKVYAPETNSNIYTPSDAFRFDQLQNMEMITCGSYQYSDWPTSIAFYTLLKDKTSGKYYSYEFGINNIDYGDAPAITFVTQKELPAETQSTLNNILGNGKKNVFNVGYTPKNAGAPTRPSETSTIQKYVLITSNNELWVLDRISNVITHYDTFSADITAIDTEHFNAWVAGIGLADGTFCLEEFTNTAYADQARRRMFTSKTKFGKEIVSIRYKSGSSW